MRITPAKINVLINNVWTVFLFTPRSFVDPPYDFSTATPKETPALMLI